MQNLLADLNPEAHEFGKKVMADKKEIEAGRTPAMLMNMLPVFLKAGQNLRYVCIYIDFNYTVYYNIG